MKEPVALEVEYPAGETYLGDESYLIAAHTGGAIGAAGDHRLLSMCIDSNTIRVYEAVSGNDRYPPGRNMNVSITFEEFEAMIKIYQARLTRKEELEAKRKAADKAVLTPSGDDFDPFLDSDDLP